MVWGGRVRGKYLNFSKTIPSKDQIELVLEMPIPNTDNGLDATKISKITAVCIELDQLKFAYHKSTTNMHSHFMQANTKRMEAAVK